MNITRDNIYPGIQTTTTQEAARVIDIVASEPEGVLWIVQERRIFKNAKGVDWHAAMYLICSDVDNPWTVTALPGELGKRPVPKFKVGDRVLVTVGNQSCESTIQSIHPGYGPRLYGQYGYCITDAEGTFTEACLSLIKDDIEPPRPTVITTIDELRRWMPEAKSFNAIVPEWWGSGENYENTAPLQGILLAEMCINYGGTVRVLAWRDGTPVEENA